MPYGARRMVQISRKTTVQILFKVTHARTPTRGERLIMVGRPGRSLSPTTDARMHPFSAGLAECPEQASEALALLHLADPRLAAAKLAGKGRVNAG